MTEVYHLQPRQPHGDYLLPLNQLQSHAPEIHALHAKKYRGREALQQTTIPLLGCLWNDVLFFSPVHPREIKAGFLAAGKTWHSTRWFAADTVSLDFTPENTVIYYSRIGGKKGDFTRNPADFVRFQPTLLDDMQDLPADTLAYYQETAANDEPIFAWRGVPHILHKGKIAFTELRLFEC